VFTAAELKGNSRKQGKALIDRLCGFIQGQGPKIANLKGGGEGYKIVPTLETEKKGKKVRASKTMGLILTCGNDPAPDEARSLTCDKNCGRAGYTVEARGKNQEKTWWPTTTAGEMFCCTKSSYDRTPNKLANLETRCQRKKRKRTRGLAPNFNVHERIRPVLRRHVGIQERRKTDTESVMTHPKGRYEKKKAVLGNGSEKVRDPCKVRPRPPPP